VAQPAGLAGAADLERRSASFPSDLRTAVGADNTADEIAGAAKRQPGGTRGYLVEEVLLLVRFSWFAFLGAFGFWCIFLGPSFFVRRLTHFRSIAHTRHANP
jgi:hypothetical protein